MVDCSLFLFFFKKKTAYEMSISDWSSDVFSSDLGVAGAPHERSFAAVNAVVARLDPPPEFILFPGDEVIDLTRDEAALRAQWRQRFEEIGRATARERVCQYVELTVGAVYLKQKKKHKHKATKCTRTQIKYN